MPIDSKVKRISLCPQHDDQVRFFADIVSETLRRASEVGHTTTLIEVRLKGEADRADQISGAATPAVEPGEESQ